MTVANAGGDPLDRIGALLDKIGKRNNLQRAFLEDVTRTMSEEERAGLDRYIGYALTTGADMERLAASYDLIVQDTVREQIYFKRHRRYRYSRYDEVASSVYMNDDYMHRYMFGLALTSYLWPNHARMRDFFLQTIPKRKRGNYVEIGPGHGFYFMLAMQRTAYDAFEGVDISPTSVQMTSAILASGMFGAFSGYRIYQADYLEFAFQTRYDAIVMGEVLEHVEQPEAFLRRCKLLAEDDAYIYVTTCINAPAIDHIALFETPEAVEELAAAAGLKIKERLLLPYHGVTLERCVRERLPINIALVLTP